MDSDELKCATNILKNIRKGRQTLKTQKRIHNLGQLGHIKLFVCYSSYIDLENKLSVLDNLYT